MMRIMMMMMELLCHNDCDEDDNHHPAAIQTMSMLRMALAFIAPKPFCVVFHSPLEFAEKVPAPREPAGHSDPGGLGGFCKGSLMLSAWYPSEFGGRSLEPLHLSLKFCIPLAEIGINCTMLPHMLLEVDSFQSSRLGDAVTACIFVACCCCR